MNRDLEINPIARVAVLVYAVITCAFVAWASVDLQMIYAAVGTVALLITVSPFLWLKTYDLFSPWSVVLVAVGVLATPQAICMSFNWPEAEPIERMMMLGKEPAYFLYPSIIYLVGWLCFTFGFFIFAKRLPPPTIATREFDERNAFLVLAVCVVLSFAATFMYVRVTGGVKSDQVSAKRTTIETLDVGQSELRQHGYLRFTGKLSAVAFVVLYSLFLSRGQQLTQGQILVLTLVFLLSCVFPFYSSSRLQVSLVIIFAVGVNYYLTRTPILGKLVVVAATGLAVFVLMSFLRVNTSSDAINEINMVDSFEKVILNRNGPGLSKTSHIINHVPATLDFEYGKTFAVWLIAPIPRELYPEKPMIHSGPIIGTTIYGTNVSGVPPGIIAELYWNFYIPGVVFGMTLLGLALNWGYQFFRSLTFSPYLITPVYVFAIFPIAFKVLGNSLGAGLVIQLIDFCMVAGVVYLCSRPVQQREPQFVR